MTPDQARFVAEGFIRDILNEEYEVVYGIHTDKEHTHVHVIWNSVSFATGKKYESPKQNWKKNLQPATNKYCKELGLEIMPAEYAKNPVNMDKGRWEYEQSFKEYILNDAMTCLAYAGSLEHFIFLMKKLGYEFKGKDYLSVKIPGMKLYHRLDKLDDIFSKEELPTILKYGYGQYYRRYQTKSILHVKRTNLTPMQKKYYAKMYRLGLIEKKCYQCHSAELAKEIKQMQFLQEQYLFICKNDISSIADLIRLRVEAKQTLEDVDGRQKEIYKERSMRKRKCKTTEEFREYQIWSMESSNELDELKADKKQAKSDIRMINACMNENFYAALGYVDETEELDYGAEDVIPSMYDYQKRDITEEFGIVQNTDRVVVDESEIKQSMYEEHDDDQLQNFHNNRKEDDLDCCEDGDWVEPAVDTDKRDYDNDEYQLSEDGTDMQGTELVDAVIVDVNDMVASITDEAIIEDVELTVAEQAEQIATTIQKYYKSYDYLSVENKARLFNFKLDDNSYNLELYGLVLKKLGIHMYGSEGFEDYQSIYGETMKTAEKWDLEYECGYEDKMWERGRGR